ncbi:MAG TPA: DUF5681 domain-containing protein, partial [Lacunisphaera sp.]
MSRARNNGSPGSDRDPSAPRARKPKTQADPAITSDGGAAGASTNNHRKDASAGSRDPDYEVGYGRPPREHQFKSGQSGNPRGRPKGSKNLKTLARKVMNTKVTLRENGKTRTVSKAEAMLMAVFNRGLGGDASAARISLSVMQLALAES